MTIQKINEEFFYKGEVFVRVFENEGWYIYKRTKDGASYYEVFMKKAVNRIDYNTKQPTGEQKHTYPRDEHFGKWAWCCRTYEKALTYVT